MFFLQNVVFSCATLRCHLAADYYFMVDAAAFNAYVIWKLQNPTWRDHAHSVCLDKRRVFLLEVGHELIRPLITHRSVTADICHQPWVSRVSSTVSDWSWASGWSSSNRY